MDNNSPRASKPLGSPQKFRPGGPPTKNKKIPSALADPLLLSPDVLDDATRRELLQEMLRPRRASPSSSPQQPVSASPGSEQNRPEKEPFANQLRARVRAGSRNSDDLLTAMAARLKELESKHKAYQSELQELHTKYRQLNDRYQRERQLREEAEAAVLTLYDEKESLERQLIAAETPAGTPRRESRDASRPRRSTGETGPAAGGSGDDNFSTPERQTTTQSGAKFDLFSGNFTEDDGENVMPTHFTNTARPGTQLFSPQKTQNEETTKGKAAASPSRAPPKSSSPPPAAKGRRHTAATVDVSLLQKNARILSDYVGWKGVVKQGNQAGIRERDVVRVVIYKNGICVNRGPFRPYGWALCDAFLDDLLDGYYPYEFKEKYPDGFPIEVTDCSAEMCAVDGNGAVQRSSASPSSSPRVFPAGGGRRLGGAPVEAGKPRPVHTLQDYKDGIGYVPVSAAEFLSNVPAQRVTASGQLVPVRRMVAALMGVKEGAPAPGSPSHNIGPSSTVKRTAAADAADRRAKAAQQPLQTERQQRSSSPLPSSGEDKAAASTLSGCSSMVMGNLIAVLVRLPNGLRVTLRMAPQDTVADLRREFIAAAPQFAQTPYELYQAFPVQCEWREHQRTLASFGIQTNCTLMVKLK